MHISRHDLTPPSPQPDPMGMARLLAALDRDTYAGQKLTAQLVASVVAALDDPDAVDLDLLAPSAAAGVEERLRAEIAWVRALACRLPHPEREVIDWRFGITGPAITLRKTAMCLRVGVATAHRIEQSGLAILRAARPMGGDAAVLRRSLLPRR